MRRKIAATAALLIVLAASGSAFAWHGGHVGHGGQGIRGYGPGPCWEMNGYFDGRGMGNFANMPAEIQQKMQEIRTTYDAIRVELSKENPDSARARSLHESILKLRREISNAKLEEMLTNPVNIRGLADRSYGWAGRADTGETGKLRTEMMTELKKDKVDAAKVRELHKKIEILNEKDSQARFEEVLKSPKQFLERQPGLRHYGFAQGPCRELTETDKAKLDQLRSLQAEIRTEMAKSPRDEAKLRDLHKKVQALGNQLGDARFEEMLKVPKPAQ